MGYGRRPISSGIAVAGLGCFLLSRRGGAGRPSGAPESVGDRCEMSLNSDTWYFSCKIQMTEDVVGWRRKGEWIRPEEGRKRIGRGPDCRL